MMSTDMPASAPQYQNGPQHPGGPQYPGNPQYQNAPQAQQIPPAPKKKRGVVATVVSVVVGLALFGAVGYGINYLTSDAAKSEAGQCASLTGTTSKPDFKTVDCGSTEANYTIGKVLGSTSESCGGYYDEYTETGRGPDSKICLVPNMVEGSCYELEGNQMGYPVVDCAKSGAFKLVKQVKGSEDESACTDGAPLTFPEPKMTLCFAPGENA
ncbi:LppU/SCO3897 family protein [Saccharothrix stipae]